MEPARLEHLWPVSSSADKGDERLLVNGNDLIDREGRMSVSVPILVVNSRHLLIEDAVDGVKRPGR